MESNPGTFGRKPNNELSLAKYPLLYIIFHTHAAEKKTTAVSSTELLSGDDFGIRLGFQDKSSLILGESALALSYGNAKWKCCLVMEVLIQWCKLWIN